MYTLWEKNQLIDGHTIHHVVLYITCLVMAGALFVQRLNGNIDIADSTFDRNEAMVGLGGA